MGSLNRLASGLRALVTRSRAERELDEELRSYLDAATDQKIAEGMTREQASREARVEIGSIEAVKDDVRDVGWEVRTESVFQDLRFAVRWFARSPRFTIPALVALALGIGATSAIVSLVRGVMLEPLPYRDPDRVVAIWETTRGGKSRNVIAPANYVVWRERTRSFESLGMVGPAAESIVVDGVPEKADGATFSAEAFTVLGVQPAIGRAYTTEEDRDPDNAVIVLSHEFWQRRLGGRDGVVGLRLKASGRIVTVVGVMPPDFTIAGTKAAFLVPYGETLEQMRQARGRSSSFAIARLRDGVTTAQATSEMRGLAAQLEHEAPERNAGRTVMLFPLQEQMVGELRPAALALVGAVVLVLLVACANVANLLLARGAAREHELGMRAALGAGRGRLVRQMLTESIVLAVAGGAGGLLVAAWFHRGLLALVGNQIPIPRLDQVALDAPMIAATIGLSCATGIVFGLAPAFVSTSHTDAALRDSGRHGGSRRLHRALNVLVVVEVALSLILLAGAGLLTRSFLKLQNVDPGFRADGVLTAEVQLSPAQYDGVKRASFFREALSRVAALPGVRGAAGVACVPIAQPCIGTSVWRTDRPAPAPGLMQSSQVRPVTPASFAVLQIPRIAGRDFTTADTADAEPVAVVSDSFARLHFGSDDPLGHAIHINSVRAGNGRIDNAWTIVGVVRDIKGSSLEGDVRPTVYVPHAQLPTDRLTLVVRTAGDPAALAGSVARVVQTLDPDVPVSNLRTLADAVGSSIARPRALSVLVTVFALVALVLAAVGVYGVMAYSVSERTQEIGVRIALGASAPAVLRLVLGHAMRLIVFGLAAGLAGAAALTRVLERLLFQIEPLDPWTFAVTATLLALVTCVASYLPARRSIRIAPVEALRTN